MAKFPYAKTLESFDFAFQPSIVEQIHGPNSPKTLERFLEQYPGAEIDGDGFDDLAAGHSNSYGFTMSSLEQCRRIREILVAMGIRQYSTFNGYIEEQGRQDVAAARWDEQSGFWKKSSREN